MNVDLQGETPLVAAIQLRKARYVEALLAAGARPQLPNPGRYQPNALFPAVYSGDPVLVNLVLQSKPDLGARRVEGGLTALHVAVSKDGARTNLVAALLAAGAPVDAVDNVGQTPLHVACRNLDPQTALLLLRAGANPNLQSGHGSYPLETAMNFLQPARFPNRTIHAQIPGQAPPPPSSSSDTRADDLIAMLRQHGADERRLRANTIIAFRAGRNYSQIVYRRGTNDFNRHQLSELFLDVFARDVGFEFPDLKNVVIHRLLPDGSERAMPLDLEKALPYGPAESRPGLGAEYQWLEWGDRVEIPETEHPISMKWGGFDQLWAGRLLEGLDRTVDLIANQRTNRFQLRVAIVGPGVPRFPFSHDSFRLHDVLNRSKLFQGTEGLQVRVTRNDPITSKPVVYEFNDANRPLVPEVDLWVRHGDVIEVR